MEQRRRHHGIAEDVIPFRKATTGGQDHGALFIPCVDRLEEQVAATVGDRQVAPASGYELDGNPPEPLGGSLKTVVACRPGPLVASPARPLTGLPGGSRSGFRPFRAGSCRPPAPETPFPSRPEAQERPFRVFGPPPSKRAFGAPRAFLRPPGAFRGVIVIGRWGLTGTAGPPPFITDQAAHGFRAGSVRNAASEPGAV